MKKEDFLQLLENMGMSRKEFAELANIPASTVANWGVKRSGKILEIPNWVLPFMHYYDKAQKLDYLTNEICEKISKAKNA